METVVRKDIIEWGVAGQPLLGQTESGDCYVVKQCAEGVLIAVIDGVGHGPEAAAAARLTVQVLEEYACSDPLIALLEECHVRLRGARGAVISLAMLDATRDTITWLGIGNIEGLLLRNLPRDSSTNTKQQEILLLRAGVVGHQLPRMALDTLPMHPGDIVIFATDGIRPDFADNIGTGGSPSMIANEILEHHALETDDALVLVVRYLHEQDTYSRA
ncbi:MAG TPA: SpoIIE family protein phosphatase [Terracidiphilus sp.]|jgi:phosphoserine phosphatase RsbX